VKIDGVENWQVRDWIYNKSIDIEVAIGPKPRRILLSNSPPLSYLGENFNLTARSIPRLGVPLLSDGITLLL